MTIKPRIIVILAVAVIVAMTAEWKFVAFMTEARVIHGYHGLCNAGVGEPYADFLRRLRTLSESGDTNTLTCALRSADERSRDIYDVWLADKRDAYRQSTLEILK